MDGGEEGGGAMSGNFFGDVIYRDAIISSCGRYRYSLVRQWDQSKPYLPFVMLNPSTADAKTDDPTIRRCISFAKRESAGGIVVVNLYAFRSSDPKRLLEVEDPIGPLNGRVIYDAATVAAEAGMPVICAWGVNDITQAAGGALATARAAGAKFKCFGKTLGGHPRHPLYVKGDQPLEDYP